MLAIYTSDGQNAAQSSYFMTQNLLGFKLIKICTVWPARALW